MRFSLIVVGGGSAAFAAATTFSGQGGTAFIINSGSEIGSTCVNTGCIPSKTLIFCAEVHHRATSSRFDGITHDSLIDNRTVQAAGKGYRAESVLISTGTTAFVPDVPGLQDSGYITNDGLYELEELPEELVVLGGGYIAMENALSNYLKAAGITVLTNTELEEIFPGSKEMKVQLKLNGERTAGCHGQRFRLSSPPMT